jgi:hypothetical protein
MGEILLKKDLEAIEFYRSDMSYGNSLGDVWGPENSDREDSAFQEH